MQLTREQKRHATAAMRLDDWSDPWGTSMSHAFGVAEVLYHADPSAVPARWKFQHGASAHCNPIEDWHGEDCDGSHNWPESEYVPFLDAGELGIAMLVYVGDVAARMAHFAKRAGRDY